MARLILFLLLATTICQTTSAQTNFDPSFMTAESREGKKVHLDSIIQFTAKEARLFWPLYNQYMWKWEKLMGERINLIQHSVNDDEEDDRRGKKEFIRSLYKNDLALTRLQKKYYSRFRKALPAPKANQVMQTEYETQSRIRVMEQNIFYL